MPTPPFAYKTVTGTYSSPNGDPGAGTLRVIPSTTVLDNAGNIVVPPIPVFATLDGSGHFAVNLLVTDDPTTSPTGWTWILSELFPPLREVSFQIPSAGSSTVNIADLAPVETVDATWQYALLSDVASLNARVTAVEADAGLALAAIVIHPFLLAGS